MDYKESLEYLNNISWFETAPGLERINQLLGRLDEPHKKLKFIHIAGTNGKGSCAAMLASIMKAAGCRTGLFTSPYLHRFNERIRINGKDIEDANLARYMTAVRAQVEAANMQPTAFELIFACAMLCFKEEKCDIVVLEAGLGGRLDATNAIDAPEAAVIMNIGLDHTAILGGSVEEIAGEKAGIIKSGSTCVSYLSDGGAAEVIKWRCDELDVPLRCADFSAINTEFDSLEGQAFSYKDNSYALPLLGENQLKNASVALETVEVLRERGWKLEQGDVEHGLYAVSWPARFELCCEEPPFVVDGGHNPQCAQTVRDNLLHYFPASRRVLMLGIMRDKDYSAVADILAEAADEFIAVEPNSPRALSAEELAELLKKYGKPVSAYKDVALAVDAAKEAAGDDGVVCATGSLYLAGELRYCLGLY